MLMNLETLNRLRVNAGKPELKSWKASGTKLQEAIQALVDQGVSDSLPGANLTAEAKTDDPKIAEAIKEPEKEEAEEKPTPPVTNGEAKLGKGLENEPMARQSRIALQMKKDREKREEKAKAKEERAAAKAEKKTDKKTKKEEPLPKGAVDPKKDPEKAARQKKHIEDKQKARAKAAPKKAEKDANEITVADIARELDIDPKVARAKLRRHEDKISKLHTKGQDRWTFPKSAKAELVKILK